MLSAKHEAEVASGTAAAAQAAALLPGARPVSDFQTLEELTELMDIATAVYKRTPVDAAAACRFKVKCSGWMCHGIQTI
jgi:hypothetical protein